mgnify:CR=1 FL=1
MNKIKFLISGLVIINILLFVVIYLNKEEMLKPQNQITPTPQHNLMVISTDPPLDQLMEISLVTSIKVSFSQGLDPTSVVIQTNPILETNILVSENILNIKPKPVWPIGQTIEINIVQARGVDGSSLLTPYKLSINSPIPND